MQPRDEGDVAEAIAQARAAGTRLELRGGGSKADIGRATGCAVLDLSALIGVVDYDPAELVLTVRPGTPLAEVEALVASQGQMLAFEPFDHGPIFGRPAGAATIGGVIAAGVSGSRRLTAGGVRDHLLGLHGVNGRGETFVAGAKVVKNVTGYDLPKLACGSWGRLLAMTEVTLKVLPRGRTSASIAVEGLDPAAACAAMAAVLGSAADVQAAAHRPAGEGPALTVVRLEGFGPSVAARTATVAALWHDLAPRSLDEARADRFWQDLRDLAPLGQGTLWRINTPPSAGPAVVAALNPARWLFDWAGGLTWLTADDACAVRAAAEAAGGHAMLVRGGAALRQATPALHPLAPQVAALEARVRAAFDPDGVFDTGRFTHAD
ncbi:glycolate oxidase subunit GlcE [Glacieibacterium frigidum]|uniref:Glycolate oxidase subunit GlcE n=1 Tax=Glacieibacterium frigidum TaxID=2593303 RepID=A0A552U8I0_9SPHN|nr:glycolate oxidase subunit GlcE [Glacieibacterium frigidum]TRW14527.1 glycolate oxidase subunit GlcE [Glacieibacterium frigidum]